MTGRRARVSRRTVLRGAAGAAIALPALELMAPRGRGARAADVARGPQRFITYFTPNGHPPRLWRATGRDGSFQLPAMLEPLAPYKAQLMIVRGLSMLSTDRPGHDAVGSLLTGTRPGEGISVDQEMAATLARGRPLPSLELGVSIPARPPLRVNLSFAGAARPRRPISDPRLVFDKLFSGVDQTGRSGALADRRRSVLDGVKANLNRTLPGLGAADRALLDSHLTAIRELETRLQPGMGEGCKAPARPEALDLTDHDRAPQMLRLQMDLLVLAFTCDLTRVATLMVAEAGAPRFFRFLDIPGSDPASSWVGLSHRTDAAGEAAHAKISRWCAGELAYLIGRLQAASMGAEKIFDRTTILWGTDCNPDHSHSDLPFLLAGGAAGRLRMGRLVDLPAGTAHNRLLITLLEGMNISRGIFGDPTLGGESLSQLF
jgi:hypothetical protein